MGRVFAGTLLLVASLAAAGTANAHCFDGRMDGSETDVDCGGACGPCDLGDQCQAARDCVSGRCEEGECTERLYDPDEPVPPGYRIEMSRHDAPATARKAGWIFFLVGYSVAYVGALSVPGEMAAMFVPVYGPWKVASRDGQENVGLLITDGVLQTAGALLLIGGYATAGKRLMREPKVTVGVAPARFGRTGYGLGFTGAF